jgi:hypothetical protein
LGDAFLLLGRPDQACEQYSLAVREDPKSFGNHSTTKAGALRIIEEMGIDDGRRMIDSCFALPSVVVFTGHMVRQDARAFSRLLPENCEIVGQRIFEFLEARENVIAYSSAPGYRFAILPALTGTWTRRILV